MSQGPQNEEAYALLEHLLAEPPERHAELLDRLCAGRPELRARVERLLRFSQDEGFLDRTAVRIDGAEAPDESPYSAGAAIGAYRLLRPLGRGGMAEVWLAERSEGGFRQQAALKLIPRMRGSLAQRFATERGILAELVHPGIARLYDGGVAADGSAYMVMEYVEGQHLTAWARAKALSLADRLHLFLQICDAVAYAHTRLVVHRDLKPANVLVTDEGQAKLLDFGIAKLVDDEPGADSTRTIYLSPAYAAPEQLTGGAISTATDVYALGMVLFELLTGTLPWPDERMPMAQAVRRVLEEPTPPSRAAQAGAPVPAYALRGDLDAIVGKALRREPEARYADARALADDVRRHLDHRPVQARAGARAYVARRFLRRHWLPLSTAALLFVAMAAAIAAVAWQAEKARSEARRAEAVQKFMVDLFKANSGRQSDPAKARQTTARELLDIGVKRIETELDDAPQSKLALLRVFGDLYDELALPDEEAGIRRQALALSRRINGKDSTELAVDLTGFAGAVGITEEKDEVAPIFEEANAIFEKNGAVDSKLYADFLIIRARYARSIDLVRSQAYAEQALAISARLRDAEREAQAANAVGEALRRRGKNLEAIAPAQRSVDVLEKAAGSHAYLLPMYLFTLSSAQSGAWQLDAAEASIRKAVTLRTQTNGEGDVIVIDNRGSLASTLSKAGKYKEGLDVGLSVKEVALRLLKPDENDHRTIALFNCGRAEVQAGELDGAHADLRFALEGRRLLEPHGFITAVFLGTWATVLNELGRQEDAVAALDEERTIREAVGSPPSEQSTRLRIRIELDEQRLDAARSLLSKYSAGGNSAPDLLVNSAQRDLLEAELELLAGNLENAAKFAGDVLHRVRSSEQAPYLRALVADGEWIEGLAHLRAGDAAAAKSLLESALATQTDLYLPKSPKIAQAQLALAECELMLGRREQARTLVEQAAAIQAQHAALSRRYTEPLQRLRAQLSAR